MRFRNILDVLIKGRIIKGSIFGERFPFSNFRDSDSDVNPIHTFQGEVIGTNDILTEQVVTAIFCKFVL